MSEAIPQNASFMVAAYVVTAVILLGYAIALVRRTRGSRDS
ncbi:MAG TPA: hypothetical protein VH833_00345 [Gemmatimonadales bacterium]|jgi:hypothetical protein